MAKPLCKQLKWAYFGMHEPPMGSGNHRLAVCGGKAAPRLAAGRSKPRKHQTGLGEVNVPNCWTKALR
jgi:hypothetical protein